MDASPLQIEHFISYICSPHIIQDLAFGERSITLSNKEIIKAGGVRATTAMHAGICFGLASFAHGGHRVRITCERQNYFFPFKISQLL